MEQTGTIPRGLVEVSEWSELFELPGPVAIVCIDTPAATENASHKNLLRRQAARRDLEGQGAPAGLADRSSPELEGGSGAVDRHHRLGAADEMSLATPGRSMPGTSTKMSAQTALPDTGRPNRACRTDSGGLRQGASKDCAATVVGRPSEEASFGPGSAAESTGLSGPEARPSSSVGQSRRLVSGNVCTVCRPGLLLPPGTRIGTIVCCRWRAQPYKPSPSRPGNTYTLGAWPERLRPRPGSPSRRAGGDRAPQPSSGVLVAAREPLSGAAISRLVGVTQPRASQVLRRLVAIGAAELGAAGYVGDRDALIDLYLSRSRPEIPDRESHWYGIRPLDQQAARIVDLGAPGSVAFSADLGPDRLVPWRHPTVAVVYSGTDLRLSDTGLVPAEGRADSSVILRHTTDATLLSPAPGWLVSTAGTVGLPLADPLQQLWDLTELGGDDRREAADRLRRAIVDRSLSLPA